MSPVLRRGRGEEPAPPSPRRVRTPPWLAEALSDGPAALAARAAGDGALAIALVLTRTRGRKGEDEAIGALARALTQRGHDVTLWVADDSAAAASAGEAQLAALATARFGADAPPLAVLDDPARFPGADIAVATGWDTVPATLRLVGVGARARLVLEDDAALLPASAEREWAAWTLQQDLHPVCAGRALTDRVGASLESRACSASPRFHSPSCFEPGVDHDVFRALPTHRRDDLVLLDAPPGLPHRATPLAALALAELHRRLPGVEIAVVGDERPLDLGVPHRHLGALSGDALAHAYASATVGIALSLGAPPREAVEMLACGLPVVGLEGHAEPPTVVVAAADPIAICDAVERLLDDLAARADIAREGMTVAAARTWSAAAAQVEAGLRSAIAAQP